MRIIRRARQVWRLQDTQSYDKTSGVTNGVYYTIFEDLKGWKKIYWINFIRDDAGSNPRNTYFRFTIDGVIYYGRYLSLPANNNVWIYKDKNEAGPSWIGLHITLTEFLAMKYTYLSTESVKFEVMIYSPIASEEIHGKITVAELEFI